MLDVRMRLDNIYACCNVCIYSEAIKREDKDTLMVICNLFQSHTFIYGMHRSLLFDVFAYYITKVLIYDDSSFLVFFTWQNWFVANFHGFEMGLFSFHYLDDSE